MNSSQREEHIYQRAYDLAASGFHINSITVVTALVQEGFPEAAELLNSEVARAHLREVCAKHWQGTISQPEVELRFDPRKSRVDDPGFPQE